MVATRAFRVFNKCLCLSSHCHFGLSHPSETSSRGRRAQRDRTEAMDVDPAAAPSFSRRKLDFPADVTRRIKQLSEFHNWEEELAYTLSDLTLTRGSACPLRRRTLSQPCMKTILIKMSNWMEEDTRYHKRGRPKTCQRDTERPRVGTSESLCDSMRCGEEG